MKKRVNKRARKISKGLYWTPRILSILFIVFLSLFALDVFGQGYSIPQLLIALFMHLIPSLILLIILIIGWKHELLPGIVFILFGLFYIGTLVRNAFTNSFEWYMLAWSMEIAAPAFLVGILFLMNWKKKR